MHLDLTIITDGFDGDGGSDGAFRVPGPELHYVLGSAHQPSHSVTVLKKLLFLILQGGKTQKVFLSCALHHMNNLNFIHS